jgi:hypothetical protein
MAYSNNTYWTLLHYGIKDKFNNVIYGDMASRLTSPPGQPFVGLSCSALLVYDNYYDYIANPIDEVVWIPKVQHFSYEQGGRTYTYDVDEVRFVKGANTGIGQFNFNYQGNTVFFMYAENNCELGKTIVNGIPVYDCALYVNLVCSEYSGAKHISLSVTSVLGNSMVIFCLPLTSAVIFVNSVFAII